MNIAKAGLVSLSLACAIMSVGAFAHDGPGPCDGQSYQCSNWASFITYPDFAVEQELEGRVTLGVKIDTNGHAFDCVILSSSGHRKLDEATCDQYEKFAHFNPALDADGNRVIGKFCNTITWSLDPGKARPKYISPLCRAYSGS